MKRFANARWGVWTVSLAAFALLVVVGCGGGKQLPPPDLTTFKKIAIAPMIYEEDPEYGMLAARDLGNQLQIALKQTDDSIRVIFDETTDRQPISDAMAALNLTLDQVFAEPKLAGKVAEALNADVLLVGKIRNLRIETDEDDTPVYDMSAYEGLSKGDTRYVITWQRASTKLWARLVNPAGEVVWQTGAEPPKEPGTLTAYLKYARAYQAAAPSRDPVPEEQIRADMRDHIWRVLAYAIYPSYFPEVKVPVWKEKPTRKFKTSGGPVRFD